MARRTSITKLQRETAAAADLIALCQTITEDGRLSEEEIHALRRWLDERRGSGLPAIEFLTETVNRILADGKITPEEQTELYLAIETALPQDIRASVRGTRVARDTAVREREYDARKTTGKREAEEKALKREAKAADEERDVALGNSPVDRWDFVVAGVTFEGRADVVRKYARTGDAAFLIRDRTNQFSKNAVAVRLSNGMQAGFVPERLAVEIAPLLDSGHKHHAVIKKILADGYAPLPIVVASLFVSESTLPALITENQVPFFQSRPQTKASEGRGGCPLLGAAVFFVGLVFIVLCSQ